LWEGIGWRIVYWISLFQDREEWQNINNKGTNSWVLQFFVLS